MQVPLPSDGSSHAAGVILERRRCQIGRILDGIRQASAQVLDPAEGHLGIYLERGRDATQSSTVTSRTCQECPTFIELCTASPGWRYGA